MDVTYINAFVEAIENVFATMLSVEVTVREPALKKGTAPANDVSGIIGLSGDVRGMIILSFPKEVAERVASLFVGAEVSSDSEDFADSIGELCNMISGNAKAKFEGKRTSISCPTVIVGTDHQVLRQSDLPAIELPCMTDCGDFTIEVSLKEPAPAESAAAAS